MTRLNYILLIVIAWLCVLLYIRGCDKPEPLKTVYINIDSIKSVAKAEQDTLATLRDIATKSANTATVYVDRWHKSKQDTSRPYKQIIADCDTTLDNLQQYNEDLCDELNQCYEVNSVTNRVVVGLEHNNSVLANENDSLRRSNKKLRRQNFGLKLLNVGQAVLNGWQGVR